MSRVAHVTPTTKRFASAGARKLKPPNTSVSPYNEVLKAEPLAESRQSPWSRDQGPKPPEAETLLACGSLMEAANLPTFLKFGNDKKI